MSCPWWIYVVLTDWNICCTNVLSKGDYLPVDKAQQHKRLEYSTTSLKNLKIHKIILACQNVVYTNTNFNLKLSSCFGGETWRPITSDQQTLQERQKVHQRLSPVCGMLKSSPVRVQKWLCLINWYISNITQKGSAWTSADIKMLLSSHNTALLMVLCRHILFMLT